MVTDYELPKLDGFQMFLKLKSINPQAQTLMCSGLLEPEMKAQMLSAGVIDFIEKPYVPDDLLHKIRTALDIAKQPS